MAYDPVVNGIAWYKRNSDTQTHPVGQKAPHGFGLYDMLGNVFEWVGGWNGNYPGGAVTDPTGPASGSFRMYRGGCWNCGISSCRSADRNEWISQSWSDRHAILGFRLLREK